MPMCFYKKSSSDAHHWYRTCSEVPANVDENSNWETSFKTPSGREQCNECKAKSEKKKG